MTVLQTGGGSTEIQLLRPAKWASSLGLVPGVMLDLAVSDAGISGRAVVTGIEPFASEIRLNASIATACFVTADMPIVLLSVEGLDSPIGVTSSHLMFSQDRGTWVPAGELIAGEMLATLNGAVRVLSVEQSAERVTVYNLEISPSHTYFVTDAHIWTHNSCVSRPFPVSRRGWRVSETIRLDGLWEELLNGEALRRVQRTPDCPSGHGGADSECRGNPAA